MASLFTSPPPVPVCRNSRLGQVWHGAEANQRSQTPKLRARVLSTGTCSGMKQCIAARGSRLSSGGWRM